MKPTLVILAAGMASRYGSMKQIDGFGPNGETIIDYSIFDAIKAGFGKVVFIIKEEYVDVIKNIFEPKLAGKIETDYAFQDFDIKRYGVEIEIERAKPWGTAHALMCAKNHVKENFCIINADDFYGFDAFEKMHKFLTTEANDTTYSLMGYEISKTLSDYGAVSRGICEVENGTLTDIKERTKVSVNDGKIVYEDEKTGDVHPLATDARASMNFWGFTPNIFEKAEQLFKPFALENKDNPKAEFFLPLVAEHLVKSGDAQFHVIPTSSQWFGVTYKEDKPIVQANIDRLVKDGVYPSSLWN